MEKEGDASAIWMTHVEMQAVSTMLNIDINILTTGLTPDRSHRCTRCKPGEEYKSGEELREHNKNVHHKIESDEEREGRIQMARWTELKPDSRIRDTVPKEKAETLVLLHNDDIHYNMIVHRSHNAFHKDINPKEHIEKDHNKCQTIFGDSIGHESPTKLRTWANITSYHRPGYIQTSDDSPPIKPKEKYSSTPESFKEDKAVESFVKEPELEDEGWQTVTKKVVQSLKEAQR